ncbi:MAG: hypothetical protein COB53_03195 [Elusimicrobia bacterium]|nr:MAG: hypothetical protein COB53_03195 [Elusimicrobiota bacterium]
MNFFLSTALAVFIILPSPVRAQDWKANSNPTPLISEPLTRDKMNVTIHRLNNGLTIYLSPNDQEPRITAWIGTRAGGAHDPEDSTGMAHYLEHMLFKGTTRLGTTNFEKEKIPLDKIRALYEDLFKAKSKKARAAIYAKIDAENKKAGVFAIPNEIDKAYKQLGIRGVNAFTSMERTVYTCNIPKNRVEAWAKLEGDRFLNPIFRLFLPEIEIVYEEKNKSLDNPGSIAWEALIAGLYKNHPYGRSVIGTVEHLKNPSLEKMYAFYDRFYRPNNMAVALAGDFDPKVVLPILEKHFGSWTPKSLPPKPQRTVAGPKGKELTVVKYEAEEQGFIAWRTVPKGHGDEAALTVMDMVLDNSQSGIINLRLNQAQKVKRAGSSPDFSNEAGRWMMYFLPKEGQTLRQAEKLVLGALDAVKNGEFSEDDLKAIVLDFEIGEKAKLESNNARVRAMMDAFIQYQDWDFAVDRLVRMRAVTKADVVRVAKKYLGKNRLTVLRRKGKPTIVSMEKPEFTKLGIDATHESAFFADVVATPAKPIRPKWVKKGRDYKKLKTTAGPLYYVKNPMNDLFSLSFRFERGSKHERKLCAALGLWNLAGAGDMTAEQLKRRLYSKGLNISTYCGDTGSGAVVSGLDEHFDEGLRLLRLRFEKPVFKKDDLAKMVQIWIGQHKDNKVNPGYIEYALKEWAQQGKDSMVLRQLTDKEVKALTEVELVALLQSFFDWERRVSYVGTLTRKEVVKKVVLASKTKADFKKKPKRDPVDYTKVWKNRVIFTHRDMVQAKVGMFAPDELYNPKHYLDYRFYSSYMSGGMSAVIFQEVREARALAYTARGGYASGGRREDENLIWGSLGCQADKTIEATNLLYSLLHKLPPSEKRFRETQNSIVQGYRTNPIKFRSVAGAVMSWEDSGIKRDPRPMRMKRAASYTLAQLEKFAAAWRERPMTLHILGNKDRVDLEALKKMGAFMIKSTDDLFPY